MGKVAAARKMQMLYPLGSALISKPPRRHTEEVSCLRDGVFEFFWSPTGTVLSRHHHRIRDASTEKLFKIANP